MADRSEIILERLTDLIESSARTEAGLGGVCQRLDRLNGSVARHEEAIGRLQIATRDIDTITRDVGELKAAASERKGVISVIGQIKPAIWWAAGIITLLALQNAPALLAAIKH